MAKAIPFLLQILWVFSAEGETVKKKDRETVNQIIQENNKKTASAVKQGAGWNALSARSLT